MKNSIHIITFFLLVFFTTNTSGQNKKTNTKKIFGINTRKRNPKDNIIRCGTVEYEKKLQKNNPKRKSSQEFEAWLNPLIARQKSMRTTSQSGNIITIPVVVHVVCRGENIGIAPNITDNQVKSQITILNQDFRRMAGTPGFNNNPVGADIEIQFELAKVDPNGNPTNGIDRVSFCQDSWGENEIDNTLKPSTIWDPTQYLNMWTVKLAGTDLLGYAQLPEAAGLQGLSSNGSQANTDGVVANYNAFGSKTFDDGTFILKNSYDKGRTMTHEVGHWLGLRHIWGDGSGDEETNKPDCSASDYCDDTPQSGWEHYVCGTFDTCPLSPGNDMPENYMDYSSDACMNIFTQNQKDRMRTIINNALRRSSVKVSTKHLPIPLFANDAQIIVVSSCGNQSCAAVSSQTTQKILLYNRGTTNLTSASIDYNISGGSSSTYNWTGNLSTDQFAEVNININTGINGTFNASIASANGVTDQRNSNNSSSGDLILPTLATKYTDTNYVFKLQQDFWGSETTWELKDNITNNIVYYGGPYVDVDETTNQLPNLITENWTLEKDKCYTFTINDSQGDGICCDGGDGSYELKTDKGAIISSGKNFKTQKSVVFSVVSNFNLKDFNESTFAYSYPNPVRNEFKIYIEEGVGLPDEYSIYDVTGKKISSKKIISQQDLTIDVSRFQVGMYFISFEKNEEKQTLKFIKE